MKEAKSKFNLFRQKTHIVIYGTNTKAGRLFDLILLGIIFLSVFLVIMETVKGFDTKYHRELLFLEWVITVFFTLEYILRIISTYKPLRYIFSFYGIIDLIATLPMYFSIFFPGARLITIIRVLRLLRLFKILNHPQFNSQSAKMKESLHASKDKILVFLYFVLISTIVIGSVMYVVEGKESGFTSIPTSIYWTIVTMTTVGYGDISPQTPLGQFLAAFVMILGYGVIAVPTGIVTAEFARNAKKNGLDLKSTCVKCETEKHPVHAEFCYKCGTALENKK